MQVGSSAVAVYTDIRCTPHFLAQHATAAVARSMLEIRNGRTRTTVPPLRPIPLALEAAQPHAIPWPWLHPARREGRALISGALVVGSLGSSALNKASLLPLTQIVRMSCCTLDPSWLGPVSLRMRPLPASPPGAAQPCTPLLKDSQPAEPRLAPSMILVCGLLQGLGS